MKSRLLNTSLSLNLLLLAMAGYWLVTKYSGNRTLPPNERISKANANTEESAEISKVSTVAATAPVTLRWSDIESEDYPMYVANLRKAGCPDPVLRRIIGAELREMYARKAFALVEDFHRNFWEIAARENVREYFDKTLAQQVNALSKEPDALLNALVGETPRQPSSPAKPAKAPDARFTDFLSAAKLAKLTQVTELFETTSQAIRQSNLSSKEKESQLAELRRKMENDRAALLSPDELAEYELRRSSAASELQQLYGVDFSETELRELAKAIDDFHQQTESQPDNDPATLEQKFQTLLGPARFADLNRARSATYREFYEAASDVSQPSETATELFNLRLRSENHSDEIRADRKKSVEEKQALLDQLEEQVEQTILSRLGPGAYQTYKARNGRWINSLGRL